MQVPVIRKGSGWLGASGGVVLAFVLLCVPNRRRFLHWLPIALVTLAIFGVLSACGGGGGSVSSQPKDTGTTPGAYTITVTATGNDSATTAASTTFTLTVN
jgi:surface-anchored protein